MSQMKIEPNPTSEGWFETQKLKFGKLFWKNSKFFICENWLPLLYSLQYVCSARDSGRQSYNILSQTIVYPEAHRLIR